MEQTGLGKRQRWVTLPFSQSPHVWTMGDKHSLLDGQQRLSATSDLLRVALRADGLRSRIVERISPSTGGTAAAEYLRPLLLATVEKDTKLPATTSSLLHKREPVDPWSSQIPDLGDMCFELQAAEELFHQHAGRSSRFSAVQNDLVRYALAAAATAVQRIGDAARRRLRDLLSWNVEVLYGTPPTETSPCGVLRLAAPIVPGAPSAVSSLSQETLTTAA